MHTGLAFLSDVRAVVFVLAEEPVSARAKLLFLRGVVCLGVCLSASSKCAWRGRRALPQGDGLGPEAASTDAAGLPAACAISPFSAPKVFSAMLPRVALRLIHNHTPAV